MKVDLCRRLIISKDRQKQGETESVVRNLSTLIVLKKSVAVVLGKKTPSLFFIFASNIYPYLSDWRKSKAFFIQSSVTSSVPHYFSESVVPARSPHVFLLLRMIFLCGKYGC